MVCHVSWASQKAADPDPESANNLSSDLALSDECAVVCFQDIFPPPCRVDRIRYAEIMAGSMEQEPHFAASTLLLIVAFLIFPGG